MSQVQNSTRWNPYSIRRCVRAQTDVDGIVVAKTKSFTRADGEWHPMVDTRTGEFSCDCPDWRYRGQKSGKPCKHLARLISNLARKGQI